MLSLTPPKKIHKRGPKARAATPPPAALTLVAATYAGAAWVRLTFDRPVDASTAVASAVTVYDGPSSDAWYHGTGAVTNVTPETVQVNLVNEGGWSSTYTTLDATAATGIVAVDDGGTWAGVADVVLPFGA